jgi:ATP-binding cassette subfamily F protein 3
MLTVHQISKSYGIQPVLQKISFSLNAGDRVGLIGSNGCGKTTLMRILAGLESPDLGKLTYNQSGLRVGYLPQGFALDPAISFGELLAQFDDSATGDLEELSRLAAELAVRPSDQSLQADYDRVLQRLQGSKPANLLESILSRLGLEGIEPGQPIGTLSGGQKTRLGLAIVILQDPQLLLLDEPTNHLDMDMLEWLEDWLNDFSGGAIIVSHDRTFLDHTVSRILDLDATRHTLKEYSGNYSEYLEQVLLEREKMSQDYQDQQEEIAQLKDAIRHLRGIARYKRGGKGDTGDKFARGFFANRTRMTVARAKHLEQRLERLMNDERIEKPRQSWQIKLDFDPPARHGKDVLVSENLSIGYPGYPAFLENMDMTVHKGSRIVLTGPNGSGKTTLLRTISGELPPLNGQFRLGPSIRLGFMTQEQESLDPNQSAIEVIGSLTNLNETEIRSFLHYFLFSGEDPLRPVLSLSFGERARLMLAVLIAQGSNFLLLDEPINHLDIPSRTRFEQALVRFKGTVFAVVHDRYFIDRFATEVWLVQDHHVHVIPQQIT